MTQEMDFHQGRRDALLEIRRSMARGQWSEQVRTQWIKEARSARSQMRHAHPHFKQVTSYHAGYISALKSRAYQRPFEEYQDGWAWYGDEESMSIAHPQVRWNEEKVSGKSTSRKKQVIILAASVLSYLILLLALLLGLPLGLVFIFLLAGLHVTLQTLLDERKGKGGNTWQ